MKYIHYPSDKKIIVWNSLTSFLYVASYVMDTTDLAFNLVSLLIPWKKTFQTFCSFVMLIDIIFAFFIADIKEGMTREEKANFTQE